MCLISLSSLPTVAEEDITVYKVLGMLYHSPYLKYRKTDNEGGYGIVRYDYEPGMNYARGPEEIDVMVTYRETMGFRMVNRYVIGSGYLHSYSTKENAMISCQQMFERTNMPHYVYEMKIPKGTKYFKSENGSEYCSKSLMFENTEPVYKEKPKKITEEF